MAHERKRTHSHVHQETYSNENCQLPSFKMSINLQAIEQTTKKCVVVGKNERRPDFSLSHHPQVRCAPGGVISRRQISSDSPSAVE